MASLNKLIEEAKEALVTRAKPMVSVLTVAGLGEELTTAFMKTADLDDNDLLAFAQVSANDLDQAIVEHNGTSGVKKLSLGQEAKLKLGHQLAVRVTAETPTVSPP